MEDTSFIEHLITTMEICANKTHQINNISFQISSVSLFIQLIKFEINTTWEMKSSSFNLRDSNKGKIK